jgi:L-ascorbate metabolism protein UlaG (beta-lactamase superfamily)
MQVTKMGHACIRLEKGGQTLVIDPGSFSEPDAVLDADAVLITHEHLDHFDERSLRLAVESNPGLEIWTNGAVAGKVGSLGVPVHVVGHGDAFTAAGFDVQVHGEHHAVIHPDIPVVGNIGFLLDGDLFHPGDALTVPETAVATLMLPTNAPWMKIGETIDYVRAVAPRRAYSLHDGLLNDNGLGLVVRLLNGTVGPGIEFQNLRSGEVFHTSAP